MTGWIIFATIIVVLLLINETDILYLKNTDYRKIETLTPLADIEVVNGHSTAVLLLHGFGGEPRSMEALGKYLAKMNMDVYIPALPGAVADLEQYETSIHPNFRLWWGFIRDRYLELSVKYETVFVVGSSLGGSMALKLAEQYPVNGIVTVASPVGIMGRHFRKRFQRNAMIALSGILSIFVPRLTTRPLSEEAKRLCPIHGIEGVLDTRAVHTQKVGLRFVRFFLPRITAPLLCIHATDDKTVGQYNQRIIGSGVSSRIVRTKTYDLSADTVTRHHRIMNHSLIKDDLYREIGTFIREIMTRKEI